MQVTLLSFEQLLLVAILFFLVCLMVTLVFVLRAVNKQNSQALQSDLKLLLQEQQKVSFQLTTVIDDSKNLKPYLEQQLADLKMKLLRQNAEQSEKLREQYQSSQQAQLATLHQHQQNFSDNQHKAVDQLTEHLNRTTQANREEMAKSLEMTTLRLTKQIEQLTESTDKRLKEISGEVEKRLAEGFEKTTQTFNDILKRLALIDDAQKKITELSSNVVSLQEVLADKRSRGAFGEVQLNALIRNVLPENHFAIQHTLSNGKIADCVLFLPPPTGNVVIDSKFPLESYRTMSDNQLAEIERRAAERQFKADIKKHINDISTKYLIDRETADGAIMFIPAEAIFAEIHAHHADLVDFANKNRVWLASPTTLMAILTTARSVLKDEATRQQVHIIQAHLADLATDFNRFHVRFNNLAKHIDQAASDVKMIHTSANKIVNRFEKIEQVELSDKNEAELTLAVNENA